jgi:hypothetical protein
VIFSKPPIIFLNPKSKIFLQKFDHYPEVKARGEGLETLPNRGICMHTYLAKLRNGLVNPNDIDRGQCHKTTHYFNSIVSSSLTTSSTITTTPSQQLGQRCSLWFY